MSDLAELEYQFSPSEWTKRFSNGDEALEYHLKLTAKETELNKKRYNSKLDISYGESDGEKYDIYYKDEEIGKPIFVYIHGGYWQIITKDIAGYCVSPLVEQGYRVIILDYDLCPKINIMGIIKQIEKAMMKIFSYASETFANHISFCGHSAGAHLIASCLFNETIQKQLQQSQKLLLKSIFLLSGVYDLTQIWRTKSANSNNILSLNDKNAKEMSPIFMDLNLSNTNIFDNLKISIVFGEHDSTEFHKQSENYHKKLIKAGLKSELKIFLDNDHFEIAENLRLKDSELVKYIMENLK